MACIRKRPFVGEYAEHDTKILTDLGFVNVDDASEYSVWKNGDIVLEYTQDDWVCDYISVLKKAWRVAKVRGRLEGIEMANNAMKSKADNFLKEFFGHE